MLKNLFHSENHVKFKHIPIKGSDEQKKTFDELNKLAFDAQMITLELELKKNPLKNNEIEALAKNAMRNHQVETYLMLVSKYPNVITSEFTNKTLHEVTPGNEFVIPLCASGAPATIFSEEDNKKIEDFKKNCKNNSPYVIQKGEWHDMSLFKTCVKATPTKKMCALAKRLSSSFGK